VKLIFLSQREFQCLLCATLLRRHDLNANHAKEENSIRKKINSIFNKRRENFSTLKEYNDYLEEVEDIVFNLLNKIEEEETRARIERYRKENQDLINLNQSITVQEERELKAQLEQEKDRSQKRKESYIQEERQHQQEKLKEQEEREERLQLAEGKTSTLKRPSRKPRNFPEEIPAEGVTNGTGSQTRASPAAPSPSTYEPNPGGLRIATAGPSPFLPYTPTSTPKSFNPSYHPPPSSAITPFLSTLTPFNPPSRPMPNLPISSKSKEDIVAERRAGGYVDSLVKNRALSEALSSLFVSLPP